MLAKRSLRQQSALGARLGVIAAIGLALAAWVPALAQPPAADEAIAATAAEPGEGEARLARLLEGRVAGDPVSCLLVHPNLRLNQIEGAAYIFGRGATILVQRTREPDKISKRDALITNRIGAVNMCRMDVYNTFDPVLGFLTGSVQFVDFVPYTRSAAR